MLRESMKGCGRARMRLTMQEADKPTQEALKRRNFTMEDAMNSFTGTVHQPIRAANRTPVVWQEAVGILPASLAATDRPALEFGDMPGLRNLSAGGNTTLVHLWKSPPAEDTARVIDLGYKVIHCTGEAFYLVSLELEPRRQTSA